MGHTHPGGVRSYQTVSFGRRRPRFWNRRVRREMGKVPSIRRFLDPRIVRPMTWDWRNVNGIDFTDGEGANQESEGACTGFGGGRFKGIMEKIADTWVGQFSERFIYNAARFLGGLLGQEGAYMVDVMNGLKQFGACLSKFWKFIANGPDKDDWPPSDQALVDAKNWRIQNFADCMIDEDGSPAKDPIGNILDTIYQLGGIDGGIPWVQSWMTPWNGDCPLPKSNDEVAGGHSICFVGYDELQGRFFFRNSWSKLWGNRGDGSCPLDSILVFRDSLGGCEMYRAVDAESHICPDGEHWDDLTEQCIPDAPEPEPTDCYSQDLKCQEAAMKKTDFWAMFWAKLWCMESFFVCALGLDKIRTMINKALGKKMSMTKTKMFKKIGVNISVTVSKPKKAKW